MHFNGVNTYLFANGTEIIKFKAKDPDIVAPLLCLGNILKDFSVNNIKKTGLNGYVYDFGVNYDAIAVDDILDIHKYLMKKNDIYLKNVFFAALAFFGCNALNVNPLRCVSINNQESRARPGVVNINSNESFFILSVLK